MVGRREPPSGSWQPRAPWTRQTGRCTSTCGQGSPGSHPRPRSRQPSRQPRTRWRQSLGCENASGAVGKASAEVRTGLLGLECLEKVAHIGLSVRASNRQRVAGLLILTQIDREGLPAARLEGRDDLSGINTERVVGDGAKSSEEYSQTSRVTRAGKERYLSTELASATINLDAMSPRGGERTAKRTKTE